MKTVVVIFLIGLVILVMAMAFAPLWGGGTFGFQPLSRRCSGFVINPKSLPPVNIQSDALSFKILIPPGRHTFCLGRNF